MTENNSNNEKTSNLINNKQKLINYYRISQRSSDKSLEAFSKVPRELFVLERFFKDAYADQPLPILARQTISAPHMCVLILDYLELEPGMKVLEIGSGSGYQAALIGEIVCQNDEGHVYTIERIPELVTFCRNNIEKANYSDKITVIEGDGTLGYKKEAPYDRIIITAAGPIIPPPLKEQLAINGILSMPRGEPRFLQTMIQVKKISENEFEEKKLTSVAFVPLKGKYGIK